MTAVCTGTLVSLSRTLRDSRLSLNVRLFPSVKGILMTSSHSSARNGGAELDCFLI